ncbi:MAG TPA: hypothetical protein VF857_05140 [Spirochaetota bacterium]
MSIKPIDMQTNIGQMHEVARKEHAQSDAVHLGLHQLDKESSDKAAVADSRLDEMHKASEMTNRLDDREGGGRRREKQKGGKSAPGTGKKRGIEIVEDASLGRIIDIKK